jgi:Leucine-rich repeat (LRR) protein
MVFVISTGERKMREKYRCWLIVIFLFLLQTTNIPTVQACNNEEEGNSSLVPFRNQIPCKRKRENRPQELDNKVSQIPKLSDEEVEEEVERTSFSLSEQITHISFNEESYFSNLPHELVVYIFSLIDPLNLLKSCTVCRGFNICIVTACKPKVLHKSETQINYETLHSIARQRYLLSIEFRMCQFTSIQASILATSHLQVLNLDHNDLEDEGAVHLSKNTTLKKLSLAATKITDAGVIALFSNPYIEDLSLECNALTDKCVENLHFINQTLLRLNLSINKLTNNGAKSIAQHLQLQSIRLYRNAIEDEGAQALFQSKIGFIDLEKNKVSAEKIKILQDLLGTKEFQGRTLEL